MTEQGKIDIIYVEDSDVERFNMKSEGQFNIAEVKRASEGLLSRADIYYMIQKGWLHPTRVQKTKIERFEFSQGDIRIIKSIVGYVKLGFSKRVAFELAKRDSVHEGDFEFTTEAIWSIMEVLPYRDESGALVKRVRSKMSNGRDILVEVRTEPTAWKAIKTPKRLFCVAHMMLGAIQERDSNAILEVKADASMIVGAVLTVAHFTKVNLLWFGSEDVTAYTGDNTEECYRDRLRVTLVDSVLVSSEAVINARRFVEEHGAVVTGVVALTDCLDEKERQEIVMSGTEIVPMVHRGPTKRVSLRRGNRGTKEVPASDRMMEEPL